MSSRPDVIDPVVVQEYLDGARALLLDARPPEDYQRSREAIAGAVRVDPGSGAELVDRLSLLPREKLFVAYCDEPGHAASAQVARRVRELGIGDASVLNGGLRAWKDAGLPVEVTLAPPHVDAGDARGAKHEAKYSIELAPPGARLTVRAPAAEDAFATAALAVSDVLGIPGGAAAPQVQQESVSARGADALLFRWLQEIVAHVQQTGRIFDGVSIRALSAMELRADLRSVDVAEWRIDLGSAAIADARQEAAPDGVTVFVTMGFPTAMPARR
jgi:rhodanese-related sulfurtransferase